jgi:hypothetical protein
VKKDCSSGNNADTVDCNGDIEGEVVGVGIRGSGGTEDAGGAESGVNKLNLTEEANGTRGAVDGSTNGLAHVTEDNIVTSTRVSGGNCGLESSRGDSHEARSIVANNVGGISNQLINVGARGSDNSGSAEEVVGVINLTNETADG